MLKCPDQPISVGTIFFLGTAALVILGWNRALCSEKILIYDEERGIILVDKATAAQTPATPARHPAQTVTPSPAPSPAPSGKKSQDIHVGRKKDPPELYFRSGLEYFKNGDYDNALRNFLFADSLSPDPIYRLWIGKTYRQMDKPGQMLMIMQSIVEAHPESDVADDALFELAFYHQVTDDYDQAMLLYARLAERYPFGVSFTSKEPFREVARSQRSNMRSEVISTLSILGVHGEELPELYSRFQKNAGLPVTAKGDTATIRTMRRQYRRHQEAEASSAAFQEKIRRHISYAWITAGVLLVNFLLLLAVRGRIAARRQHLNELRQSLADLKVSNP